MSLITWSIIGLIAALLVGTVIKGGGYGNLTRVLVSIVIVTVVFFFSAESGGSFSGTADLNANQRVNASAQQPSPQQEIANSLNDQLLMLR